jgi:hypothetical protein
MARKTAVAGAAVVGLLVVGSAPAAARTTGPESVRGHLVTSGTTGTRSLVSSLIVATGVFRGVGTAASVPNQPGDPPNVSRADLVYASGRMHIVSTNGPPQVSLNPQTCTYELSLKQTSRVRGGTRRFRGARGSFSGTVRAWGVAGRNADGTCSMQAAPLVDTTILSSRGTLSY